MGKSHFQISREASQGPCVHSSSGVSEGTEAQLGTSGLPEVGTDGELSGMTVSGAMVATGWLSRAGSRANKCDSKLLLPFGLQVS